MIIRQFDFDADYKAVIEIWENAGLGVHLGRSDSSQEIAKKLKRDPELFLVAEVDNQIVGTVLRQNMMGVAAYDVSSGCQTRISPVGYRRTAHAGTRKSAMQIGCIRYYILVTVDNLPAISFYEKRGWNRLNLYAYGKDLV